MSEDKIKAFSLGGVVTSNKRTSDKRKDEKGLKLKRDAEATAAVFKEYIESFEEPKPAAKQTSTFVRGDTIIVGSTELKTLKKEDATKLYSLGRGLNKGTPGSDPLAESNTEVHKKNKRSKINKKSELELFKEQLEAEEALKKAEIEERERREKRREEEQHRRLLQAPLPSGIPNLPSYGPPLYSHPAMPFAQPLAVPGIPFAIPPIVPPVAANKPELDSAGSFPSNNNDTTNLYVGNLSPQVTEEILCMEFGVFGPLASVKIMWPRSAEEHSRGRNCGFVAFMNREDAAKSKDALDGKELLGYELRVGWGKCVTLPSQPFYVHKTIRDENTLTGLPFNARPLKDKRERDDLFSKVDLTALEQALYNSEISVPIPKDVTIRRLIHRLGTIEALVNEGALFEQVLMIKVARDPKFKFLFNYASPEHRYYRWKLYSVLQGDEVNSWRTTRFRMYEKGSFWVPPTLEEARLTEHVKKGQLTAKQRDELEDLLRNLTLARTSIKEAMGFCLENCEAAPEIVECITESLCILETPIQLKVARFFVVSDILNNTAMQGASYYRTQFEQTLPQIVGNLNSAYRAIPGRMRAELFKKNILNCIAAWEEWALYPFDFLNTLKTAFTAAPIKNASVPATASPAGEPEPIIQAHSAPVSSVDHVAPATALPGFKVVGSAEEEDIDGEDIVGSEDIDGEDIEGEDLLSKPKPEALKPGALSKWCSISDDEEAVNSK